MSVYATMYVWETSKQKSTALLALLAIADYADEETGAAYPGVGKLSAKLRMQERNTQTILRKLEANGEIIIEENKGAQTPSGRTNRYTLVGYLEWYKEVQKIASLKRQGVQIPVERGATFGSQGVQELAPNPSVEPSENPPDKDSAPSGADTLVDGAEPPTPIIEDDSPKDEKPWHEMSEGQKVGALINVYVKGNNIIVPKTPRIGKNGKPVTTGNPFANIGNRNNALTLIENGITVTDLQDFFDEKRSEAFWDGKEISWTHILKNIGAFVDINSGFSTPSSAYANAPVEPGSRPPAPDPSEYVPCPPDLRKQLEENMAKIGRFKHE